MNETDHKDATSCMIRACIGCAAMRGLNLRLIEIVIALFLIYLGLGVLHALVFLLLGLQRVDPIAKAAGAGVKVMVFPGIVLLWPIMLRKWVRA